MRDRGLGVIGCLVVFALMASPRVAAADWVIGGDDPDETVVLSSDRFVDGNLVILNNGRLTVTGGGALHLSHDVYLFGNACLDIRQGTLRFRQEYAYQSALMAADQAAVEVTDGALDGNGHSFSVALAGSAAASFTRAEVVRGFATWALFDQSAATLVDCINAGEFVPFGEVTLSIADSETVLLWMTLFDGTIIDTILPPPGDVAEFRLDVTTPWATNIPYAVHLVDCRNVMWALMGRSGAHATVRDSVLRAVGTIFERGHAVEIAGLADNTTLAAADFHWGDIDYTFHNTSVRSWNYYCRGTTRLTLRNCVFGELIVEENGEATVQESVCDGSGGYLGVFGDGRLVLFLSTNLSQLTCADRGVFIGFIASQLGRDVHAAGNAAMLWINCLLGSAPRALDAAGIVEARIEPVAAVTGDLTPLRGTAQVIRGPDSPLDYDGYLLEYGTGPEPATWIPIAGPVPEMRHDEILGHWPTAGLAPGVYTVRLTVLTDGFGPIVADAPAELTRPWLPGDLDGDGAVTPADWRMLLYELAGGLQPEPAAFAAPAATADLDGDGRLTAADAVILHRLSAGR